MKKYFAKSKNGIDIYINTEDSHALTHFAHNQKLIEAVKRTITTLEVKENITRVEREMTEDIGTTDLVVTNKDDEIVYALRPLRTTYSRFVKNKKSVSTKWITVDIRKRGELYFLYTSFVGRLTPSFPGGDFLPKQSREFWSNHALVWGAQEVVPGTETTECPW